MCAEFVQNVQVAPQLELCTNNHTKNTNVGVVNLKCCGTLGRRGIKQRKGGRENRLEVEKKREGGETARASGNRTKSVLSTGRGSDGERAHSAVAAQSVPGDAAGRGCPVTWHARPFASGPASPGGRSRSPHER